MGRAVLRVRGDRWTRAVCGDDARESPAGDDYGVCGARGHAARPRERVSAPLILGQNTGGDGYLQSGILRRV